MSQILEELIKEVRNDRTLDLGTKSWIVGTLRTCQIVSVDTAIYTLQLTLGTVGSNKYFERAEELLKRGAANG